MTLTAKLAASRIVTTDEVLTEYLTFFSTSPEPLEPFLAGLQLYRARSDKGYSLVDCISMHTMRKEELDHT